MFELQAEEGESFGLECKFSNETPGLLAVEYETVEDTCGLLLIDTEKQSTVKLETTLESITDIKIIIEILILILGAFILSKIVNKKYKNHIKV